MGIVAACVALVERRAGLVVAGFLLTAAAVGLTSDFTVGHRYDDWIDHGSARYRDYQRLLTDFGDSDTALAVFPLDTLDAVSTPAYVALVATLRTLAGVTAVFDPLDLLIETGIDGAPEPEQIGVLRDALAQSPPDYRSVLVSRDVRMLGLLMLLDPAQPAAHASALTTLREGLAAAHIPAELAGTACFSLTLQDAIARDMQHVIALLSLTGIIVLLTCLRDLRAVLAIFAGIALATLFALALGVAVGLRINLMTLLLLPLVFCVGMTTAVHLFTRGGAGAWRYADALPQLFAPTLIAALTTAVGCASFASAPQPVIADMGLVMPGAVLITLVTVLLFVPALHAVLARGRPPARPRSLPTSLPRRARQAVSLVLIVVAGAAGAALPRLETNPDALFFFADDAPLMRAYRHIEDTLTGLLVVDVVVRSTDGAAVTTGAHAERIGAFVDALRRMPDLTAVVSGHELLRLRKFGLPEPPGLGRAFFTPDEQATRLVLRFRNAGTRPYAAMRDAVLATWQAQAAAGLEMRLTGLIPLILDAQDELLQTQTGMFLAGLAGACLLIALFVRDRRLIVPALLANFIPLLITAGTMVWFAVPINSINFFVGGVVLGVIVDDTAYLLHACRAHGDMQAALAEVGSAIGITSATVALAFAALVAADLLPVRQFGLLSVVAITSAWLCNVCLLPVLLHRYHRRPA